MEKILRIATSVSTPLALSGLIVGVLFLIFKQILSMNIFPQLSSEAGGTIIIKLINTLLILSLVSIVLGFIAYIAPRYLRSSYPTLSPEYVQVGIDQDKTLEEIVRAVATERNVTVNFNQKCDQSIRGAIIEAGTHEGNNIKEFLENLRQRVKGQSINYNVIKEGDRRYEITCS